MKKIIIATDSFKGTLSAQEATKIIAEEFKKQVSANIIECPIADGGEGTIDILSNLTKGKIIVHECTNLQLNKVNAKYLLFNDKTAIIESAQTVGLNFVKTSKNVGKFTTFGVGEQVLHAIKKGANKIYVALGGSGTNDFGCGLMCALGAKFFNKEGKEFLPVGRTLIDICDIDLTNLKQTISNTEIFALCDVVNPPYGKNGASYIYAPQKGASPEECELLDNGVKHLCNLVYNKLGINVHNLAGGGAAGAMGGGLVSFCGAKIISGIDYILSAYGFKELLKGCDLVITGEGCTDEQSASGKVISGISSLARFIGVPVVVISGRVRGKLDLLYNSGIKAIYATTDCNCEITQEGAIFNLRKKASEIAKIIASKIKE